MAQHTAKIGRSGTASTSAPDGLDAEHLNVENSPAHVAERVVWFGSFTDHVDHPIQHWPIAGLRSFNLVYRAKHVAHG